MPPQFEEEVKDNNDGVIVEEKVDDQTQVTDKQTVEKGKVYKMSY